MLKNHRAKNKKISDNQNRRFSQLHTSSAIQPPYMGIEGFANVICTIMINRLLKKRTAIKL